jgi:alpha-glucosidase
MIRKHTSHSWATVTWLALAAAVAFGQDQPRNLTTEVKVTGVPGELRESAKLDPFYEKYTDAGGLPILSSKKVSDEALLEARQLILQMLSKREDVLQAIVKSKCRFVVMAPNEMTTDVPEQRNMKPKDYWDKRARGLGGRITSCGEENLLNLKSDRYRKENILIHEFAHCIHNYGLRKLDPKFDSRLRATFERAKNQGLWKDTYALTNHGEYWAEAVQSYFDCNAPPGGVHNDVNTREKLAKYDPDLFALIDESFRQNEWRYVRYDQRGAQTAIKQEKPKIPVDAVQLVGQASEYFYTRNYRVYYWREDFSFLLKDEATGMTWRIISREPTPAYEWRMGTTFPELKVDWDKIPRVKVVGVTGIDRQPADFYDFKLNEPKIATAHVVWVQTGPKQWKEYYVNNWFHKWSENADRLIYSVYADKGVPYDIYGYVNAQSAPFSKPSQKLVEQFPKARMFHGLIKKNQDWPFGYEIELLHLIGPDAGGNAVVYFGDPAKLRPLEKKK